MQSLDLDPAIPFLIPADAPIHILLVGCGGTGSHIAQSLARLAYHVERSSLPPLAITLADGDTVELRNVGRQLFTQADVGRNKAQVLAARLSALFGLKMAALPDFVRDDIAPRPEQYGVLVGAVDTPQARRALCGLTADHGWRLWLDAGNERDDGQVCIGNATTPQGLHRAFAIPGVCAAIPAPNLVYPDLLNDQPAAPVGLACAEAMQADAQGLMINQAMAAIVAQYLYQIVVTRRLITCATSLDLSCLAMRSQPITARMISTATGIPLEDLCGN